MKNRTKKLKRGGALDTTLYDIVVIAGQSNGYGVGRRNVCDSARLSGCGGVVDLRKNSTAVGPITNIPNLYDSPNSKIKQFSGEWNSDTTKRNKIIEAINPLETFVSFGTGTNSFGMSFAKDYIADSQIAIGTRNLLLVNCSYAGTGMDSGAGGGMKWRKPTASDDLSKSLYTKTVQRLRNLKTLLHPTNNSKVVAFLWHQGETDEIAATGSAGGKTNYKNKLKQSLEGMREEIMGIFNNNNDSYVFPILLGGLCLDMQFNRITGVRNTVSKRQEMCKIISEVSNPNDRYYIENSAFVSSDYLTFSPRLESNTEVDDNGNSLGVRYADGRFISCASADATERDKCEDNSHFSATANRELGERYFHYYKGVR
jgi:hypothetical protein